MSWYLASGTNTLSLCNLEAGSSLREQVQMWLGVKPYYCVQAWNKDKCMLIRSHRSGASPSRQLLVRSTL
ncbi:hypothetical protein BD289DRAFT_422632 [Coniella lustricola]|uniref:Uncharacterized protein n=1 Tax=Coniella lustricola TaxID=2025994 RepID=A0A2T3AKE3_9PEZI|nr:hypothetical protein BD289DRAFT_422632 [Coniella lustricola]